MHTPRILAATLALALLSLFSAGAQNRITIRQFLRMSKKDTSTVELRGVVERVRNKTNGNLYLNDRTGTVLIYGVRDGSGQGRKYPELDVCVGDTLTLVGRRSVYDGNVIEMAAARLVAKSDGPDHEKMSRDDEQHLVTHPTFRGKGQAAFAQWVTSHLVYPKEAREKQMDGTVLVKFVVGRKGNVQEVEVVKGVHPLLNDEAVRVVKSSPKWKPGTVDGRPVRVNYTIPVIFIEE